MKLQTREVLVAFRLGLGAEKAQRATVPLPNEYTEFYSVSPPVISKAQELSDARSIIRRPEPTPPASMFHPPPSAPAAASGLPSSSSCHTSSASGVEGGGRGGRYSKAYKYLPPLPGNELTSKGHRPPGPPP
eukprot:CAMPEP_0182472522 /NCGR_PEP_ID=MMETSP1319-20130603/22282_1 /TAXON_ID=172717 /ORGANISM="Bolidomonas pacifica, Strain RCC208" /LENGTH=131 /DNA_ID=CAMNT_0024673215 /DNA_START=36 /DNA_END=429 /DNA_ORIENTATION=-